MRRTIVAVFCAVVAASAAAAGPAASAKLSVDDILAKNVAARGGLEAWRAVHTMLWAGHIESQHAAKPSLQFLLEQERVNKTRFEINALGDRTVRVFDGEHGWNVHAGRDGRPKVQLYTIDEIRYAQGAHGIDSPLIDHAAKNIDVALDALDNIDGRRAYRLEVRLPSGETDRIWIDAESFLEVRYDRMPSAAPGRPGRVVSTVYRDYKTFDGLAIPTVIETGGAASGPPDRMVVERVIVNPALEEHTFANPATPRPRHGKGPSPRPGSPAPAPAAPAEPAPAANPDEATPPR